MQDYLALFEIQTIKPYEENAVDVYYHTLEISTAGQKESPISVYDIKRKIASNENINIDLLATF
jgi:hypothetical protein